MGYLARYFTFHRGAYGLKGNTCSKPVNIKFSDCYKEEILKLWKLTARSWRLHQEGEFEVEEEQLKKERTLSFELVESEIAERFR